MVEFKDINGRIRILSDLLSQSLAELHSRVERPSRQWTQPPQQHSQIDTKYGQLIPTRIQSQGEVIYILPQFLHKLSHEVVTELAYVVEEARDHVVFNS